MEIKNIFNKLPTDVLSHIFNFLANDLAFLGRCAKTDSFFRNYLNPKFEEKTFLSKIANHYLAQFPRININDHINNMEIPILRDIIILLQVIMQGISNPRTPKIIDELLTHAACYHDETPIYFLINLLVAITYIHPELKYVNEEQYFSQGFDCAQKCFATNKNDADVNFTLSAYWKYLYEKNELKIKDCAKTNFFQQKNQSSVSDVWKESEVSHLASDVKKAQQLSLEYLKQGIKSLNQNLGEYYLSYNDLLKFAHPLCRFMFEKIVVLLQNGEINFDSLNHLSSKKVDFLNSYKYQRFSSNKEIFINAMNMSEDAFVEYSKPFSVTDENKEYETICLPNNKRFKSSK